MTAMQVDKGSINFRQMKTGQEKVTTGISYKYRGKKLNLGCSKKLTQKRNKTNKKQEVTHAVDASNKAKKV